MATRRYGIPYQGSKNQIAEELLSFLPSGKRFVDLFGGGGAMTDCAMDSYKWDSFLYNEINPLVFKAFGMALRGEFKGEKRWIDRATFIELRETDPYVAICFSFSNNMNNYCYAQELEPWKKALHYAMVFKDFSLLKEFGIETDDVSKRNIRLHKEEWKQKYISWWKTKQSLQNLERMERLDRLQSLQNLELTNDTYLNYEHKEGDVVYCDIPYEGTDCNAYKNADTKEHKAFDTKEFYDWCATRPYQVFFSSYEISDNRFHRIWEREKKVLNGNDNSLTKIECLYSNEPYLYSSLLGKQYEFDFLGGK